VEVWQTRNDEIVCPICGPRHGKEEGDGWTKDDGPPAHPRCRCWTNHVLPGKKLPKDISNISNIENEIRNQKYETGIVYDKNGNLLLRKDGSETQVGFSPDEIKQMNGGVLTHNHPGGSSFSFDDVNVLRYANLEEVRAVDSLYSYSFKTSNTLKNIDVNEFYSHFKTSIKFAENKIIETQGIFDLDRTVAHLRGTHWCMEHLAGLVKAQYTRVPYP